MHQYSLLRVLVLPNDGVLDRKVGQSAHSYKMNNWRKAGERTEEDTGGSCERRRLVWV